MSEQIVTVPTTGVELCYETFGDAGAPPMVLIMGLGTQMIAWPDELCSDLAARGYLVIRFDNRDVGRSTHFTRLRAPDPLRTILGRARPPYSLDEMASDVVGLMDALSLESAHVVGASMGGFIAQLIATSYPTRVRSLALIMTSTGSRLVGHPKARLATRLANRRPARLGRDEAIALVLDVARAIGSSGYPFDEAHLSGLAGRAYDRSYDPGGFSRQLSAILAQKDRTRALRRVAVPTVVVHGLADPLVGVSGGRALARAIPGARFVGLAGMGHDLPRALWGRIADEIARSAAEGEHRLQAVRTGPAE